MDWMDETTFPLANGKWQAIKLPFGRIVDGEARVEKIVRNSHPFSTALITTPQSQHFLPPVCTPETQARVRRRFLLQRKFILIYLLLCLLILLTWYLGGSQDRKVLVMTLVTALFFVFFAFDYGLSLRVERYMQERALYLASLCLKNNRDLKLGALLFLMAGLMQYFVQRHSGGLEPLIRQYGLMNDFKLASESWRLISGPFIHSSITHWANNFIYLIITLALTASFRKHALWWLMLFLVLTGLAFRLIPYPLRPDALVGISGGIFALFGLSFHDSLMHRDNFPRYFFVMLGCFIVMMTAFPYLLSPRASGFAHLTGLLTGFIAGFLADSPMFAKTRVP
ncbi:MAG: rhomboid family intramembrane serine protease [Pseudomonadales bacterium]|nr:rhomboid family intramembrane serine protease [Pseudomonadales bacterium]